MRRILPLLAALALAGCATITADTHQEIFITTEPAGAQCQLKNGAGQWAIEQTPGSVQVKRSYTLLSVWCTHANLRAATVVEPRTRNRAYGNILLGGVPALVDAKTGDGYEYEPAKLSLKLIAAKP